jgi:hypothetical protein
LKNGLFQDTTCLLTKKCWDLKTHITPPQATNLSCGSGVTGKKQPGGLLTADNSQDSHHQKNFKHNHMDETVKKMVDNPAANDGRYGGIDKYAQFSRYIHLKHILSGHDGVSVFLP